MPFYFYCMSNISKVRVLLVSVNVRERRLESLVFCPALVMLCATYYYVFLNNCETSICFLPAPLFQCVVFKFIAESEIGIARRTAKSKREKRAQATHGANVAVCGFKG